MSRSSPPGPVTDRDPVPSLAEGILRLAGAGIAVTLAAWGLVWATAWLALPLDASEVVGVGRLCRRMIVVTLVVLAAGGAVLFRRFAVLHRSVVAVVEVIREELGARPSMAPFARSAASSAYLPAPPPPAVVHAAFVAPTRLMLLVMSAVISLLALDATSIASLSGIDSPRRVAVDILAAGIVQALFVYGAIVWRAILWAWLRRLPPSMVTLPTRPRLAGRLAARGISAVLLVGAGALAVLVAFRVEAHERLAVDPFQVDLTLVAAFTMVAVLCLVAGHLGIRLGRVAARDVRSAARYVEVLTVQPWSEEAIDTTSDQDTEMHTRAADDLVRRIRALALRYADLAADEADARRAIEDAQRLKSRFMAYMSHDLRSPLNSITGFAEVLARGTDGPLNDEQLESVETIQEAGADLLRLVTDIVDSARLEAGRLRMHPQWMPAPALLRDAIAEADMLIRRRPLRLVADFPADLPPVYVDGERVLQALVNVLAHVVRLMEAGPVHVRARMADGPPGPFRHVRVEVDAAEGITPERRERIFEAFREIREPSGRRVGGLGLGLALARSLIVEQGGDLWYEAQGPRGAKFCAALPVDAPLFSEDDASP